MGPLSRVSIPGQAPDTPVLNGQVGMETPILLIIATRRSLRK